MYGKGYRYFLVTAVVKSPSINIIADDEQKRAVDVDVKALQIANISTNVSLEYAGKGEIIFKGKHNLVFGVGLYELIIYDSNYNCFRFKTVAETVKLRDKGSEIYVQISNLHSLVVLMKGMYSCR
jgi:hypothetical protein